MRDKTKIILIVKGVLVGLVAGVIVSIFRLFIELGIDFTKNCYSAGKWWIPAGLSLVAALVVWALVRWEPGIRGSGIPQVEGELAGDFGPVKHGRVLVAKFFGGILTGVVGLFVGREGPSIQLGAMSAGVMADLAKSGEREKKIMISSGAAAGLAAAFNAPLAGLMFILEEVHHSFAPLLWITALASALSANFVSLQIFGLRPVLDLGMVQPIMPRNYWVLLVLGVVVGLFACIYNAVTLNVSRLKIPLWLPFLLVVPIGMFFTDTLGGGASLIISEISSHTSLAVLIGLFVLRFVFSTISYGSGVPGGIFLPILTLGAFLGLITYSIMNPVVHFAHANLEATFATLAMAGLFAAVSKAPITAIVLVTEMVGHVDNFMMISVVVIIAYVVADFLGNEPIYEALLEKLLDKEPRIQALSGVRTCFNYNIDIASALDGAMIRDVRWPDGVIIAAIIRGEHEFIASGDSVISAGDLLVVATDKGRKNDVITSLGRLENGN
ncbi:MAG: chloride channel protein [Lactobacillales bacterium]|jgi:H+/Cl- antiporter ClcA|nr:chloride channel protein [Lactobacillales bacterium]